MDFTNVLDFLRNFGGPILAIFGAAFVAFMAGIGSARGVGMVGEAAAGLVTEEPEKFGKTLILQVIPGTQGFYGFITALILLQRIGLFTGKVAPLTLGQGFLFFCAILPSAIVQYRSAIFQAKTAVAGIQILAKRPERFFGGVIYAVMVETYAVIALITSILMIVNIPV
jgi:V/A-type H+-transporting ATPase subunit K